MQYILLYVGVNLSALKGVLYIFLRNVLTLVSQLVVELETSIRRSVCQNLNVFDVQALFVAVDLLEHLNELLNGVVLHLALAQVSLVDEELDLSLLLLSLHSLERVWCDACSVSGESLLVEL